MPAPGRRLPRRALRGWDHLAGPEVAQTQGAADNWACATGPVGDQEKIVWRMTGTGLLTLEAIGPGSRHHRLAWGPDAHESSNWDKPGDEWGAGYVFAAPGCWDPARHPR